MTTLDRASVYGTPAFWIRAVYRERFLDQTITAVVRPGDRSNPEKTPDTHLPEGVDLAVRFLKKPGKREEGTMPEFYPDDGTTMRIVGHIVKQIKDLTVEDLVGTAPDTATPELVRYHLGTLYDTPLPHPDDVVTIWRFEYRPNAVEGAVE